MKITETDTTGHPTRAYVLTTTATSPPTTRLDIVPQPGTNTSPQSTTTTILSSPTTFIKQHILPAFLPHGYPHTVTPDYTPYQIYDSLQAFASSIAGLLSSRAVLQSLGFDTDSSTSTATYATLLSIAQATVSNLTTILFAHRASSRIAAEVKYYRFLADIVNDAAFVLDCLSPSLPRVLKVPVLCLSSAFRAVCGVAAGSSKAVLSAHFAKNGNVGELNAKDGSQETVLSLVGMWVGGVVVSRVDGLWATWIWMLVLLGLHLWFNYCAVRSVRLRGLNGNRANLIMSELISKGVCKSMEDIGKQEGVFQTGGWLRRPDGSKIGNVSMGVGLATLMGYLGGSSKTATGSIAIKTNLAQQLFTLFQQEQYLLWFDVKGYNFIIVLKDNATVDDQLKAWCHAVRLCGIYQRIRQHRDDDVVGDIQDTLHTNNASWPMFRNLMEQAGWDVTSSMLETRPGVRLSFSDTYVAFAYLHTVVGGTSVPLKIDAITLWSNQTLGAYLGNILGSPRISPDTEDQ